MTRAVKFGFDVTLLLVLTSAAAAQNDSTQPMGGQRLSWLMKPSAVVPGTRMAFAGLEQSEDREAMIAFLNSATKYAVTASRWRP